MPSYPIQLIADRVGGRLLGSVELAITGVETLDGAAPGQMTFVRDNRHARRWPSSRATAALVTAGVDLDPGPGRALICVEDADLAMAGVLEMFAPPRAQPGRGIHQTATVDPTARIATDAAIGAGCVIGKRVRIDDGCVVHANVTVLDDAVIGAGCTIYPGTVIYDRCELGARVIVHANAVIGADGFNYRPASDASGQLVKVPQIGAVIIADDVEIGAGTCIDRGKFSATTIGSGTKIDNLCQIAHNCRIGRHCVLAGQVGLAGSVTVGDGVMVGGQAGATEQVTLGKGSRLTTRTAAISDVPPGATWFGYPGQERVAALRQIVALRRLPDLMKTLNQWQNKG